MATSVRRGVRVLSRSAAARRREESAGLRVGALFDEFAPMVLAVCRFNLRDPQAAEDAAQETFLSAYRSLLSGTRARDPAAWLATIARNECRRTRQAARPAQLDEDTTGARLDPADIVAERAEFSAVASAIAELPARQREALVLREFCGLSYEQVAAAMSVSGAAVDSLLSRARRRLVEQLGDIPRVSGGVFAVPASLREELSRTIPGLDALVVGTGAGGAATLASLGSAPVAAKVAATCVAAAAVALPVQATVRGDEGRRADARPRAAETIANEPRGAARSVPPPVTSPAPAASPAAAPRESGSDSSGRASDGSGSSGPGSGDSGSDDSGSSGSGSSGSGSDSDSSGSGSSVSGSDSSGSGSSGSGSDSGSSGSGSSGSGSDSSGSGSDSSGSGSSGSGSDSGSSGSGSDSDSSGSGSSGSGSDSDSSGSGSGG